MVIYQSKKKCQFNVFKPQSVSKKWQMICGITLPLLFVVGWSFLNGSPGFYRLYNSFPHNMFALQYTYYVFEMLLAGLIISFSQKVFDNVKKKDCRMPWGGLILGLSWGLGHYITKGNLFVALFAFVVAIFFGLIYNWLGKDLKKTWPLMFLVFVCL